MVSDEFGRWQEMPQYSSAVRSLSAAVGGLVILHAQDIGEKVDDMNVRYIAKLVVVVVALLYVRVPRRAVTYFYFDTGGRTWRRPLEIA